MKTTYLNGMFDGGGNYVPSNIGGGSSTVDISGGKKSFSDTKFGQGLDYLIKTGVSVAKIYQAFKEPGTTIIKDNQGNSHDISQMKAMAGQIAQQKNTSLDQMMQLMMMQLIKEQSKSSNSNNNNKDDDDDDDKKDNTALYIGLGVVGLVLVGGIVVLSQKK